MSDFISYLEKINTENEHIVYGIDTSALKVDREDFVEVENCKVFNDKKGNFYICENIESLRTEDGSFVMTRLDENNPTMNIDRPSLMS